MIWTLRYGLVMVGAALGVGLSVRALGSTQTSNIITTLHVVVPVIIAALVEGMQHARAHRAVPSRAGAWRWAVMATLLSVSLAVLLAQGAAAMAPAFAAVLGQAPMARNLVVVAGLYLLINRYLLTYGARGHLNTMRRRGEIE